MKFTLADARNPEQNVAFFAYNCFTKVSSHVEVHLHLKGQLEAALSANKARD